MPNPPRPPSQRVFEPPRSSRRSISAVGGARNTVRAARPQAAQPRHPRRPLLAFCVASLAGFVLHSISSPRSPAGKLSESESGRISVVSGPPRSRPRERSIASAPRPTRVVQRAAWCSQLCTCAQEHLRPPRPPRAYTHLARRLLVLISSGATRPPPPPRPRLQQPSRPAPDFQQHSTASTRPSGRPSALQPAP